MARILLALIIGLVSSIVLPAAAQEQEKRLALVIGNGAYEASPLQTAANDAGLVAQTLQAAGFDVIGARDLDGDTLRKSFRDFVQKVEQAGPNTVAFLYLAGYGVQLTGENYFIPVDAKIVHDTDVPVEGLRLSDYMRQLSALPVKANIVVLDGARANPFAKEGQPLAGGLALVEPDTKMLVAFNAAPGTVAPESQPPYGAYAQALAEMIRAGGLSLPEVFDRVRLRVNEATKGAEIPWDAQKIDTPFVFFERKPDAPPVQVDASLRTKPIRDFDARDAYAAALERDTLQGYEEFLQAFPQDPLCARVRAIVAARREAMVWRRTYRTDTPDAYWSYLDRYPRGPHAADARRRLAVLSAALEPPPSFTRIVYDVPPPPPEEIVYIERPVIYFDDPVFAFAPPPPPPVFFLPPPPPEFVVLPPPPPPVALFVLPTPVFVAMPVYVSPPAYVAPPPNNIVFANIHNTTVINNVINNPRPGLPQPNNPTARAGGLMPAAAPSLPPAAVQKANLVQPSGQGAGPPAFARGAPPTAAGTPPGAPPGAAGAHALPGMRGQPLPQTATAPANAAPAGAAPRGAAPTATPTPSGAGAPNALTSRTPGGAKGQPSPRMATAPATGTQPNTTRPQRAGAPSLAKPTDTPRRGAAPPSPAPHAPAAAALAKPVPPPTPARPSPPSARPAVRAAVSPPPAARPTPVAPAVHAPPRAAVAPPHVSAPPSRVAAPPPRWPHRRRVWPRRRRMWTRRRRRTWPWRRRRSPLPGLRRARPESAGIERLQACLTCWHADPDLSASRRTNLSRG